MKSSEFSKRAIRHGEVVIIPVDRLPVATELVSTSREVIVGHSESGHHHIAVSEHEDLTLFRPIGTGDLDKLYLQVMFPSRVEHRKTSDQHEAKPLAPGFYEIYIKNEYDYFAKRSVKVVD